MTYRKQLKNKIIDTLTWVISHFLTRNFKARICKIEKISRELRILKTKSLYSRTDLEARNKRTIYLVKRYNSLRLFTDKKLYIHDHIDSNGETITTWKVDNFWD